MRKLIIFTVGTFLSYGQLANSFQISGGGGIGRLASMNCESTTQAPEAFKAAIRAQLEKDSPKKLATLGTRPLKKFPLLYFYSDETKQNGPQSLYQARISMLNVFNGVLNSYCLETSPGVQRQFVAGVGPLSTIESIVERMLLAGGMATKIILNSAD